MTARLATDRAKIEDLVTADPYVSLDRIAEVLGCSIATLRLRMIAFKIKKPIARYERSNHEHRAALNRNSRGLAAPNDLHKEMRQIQEWPVGMRFEDAAVPAERFLGRIAAAPVESSASSPLVYLIGED